MFGLWGSHLEVSALQTQMLNSVPNISTLQFWDYQELQNDNTLTTMQKNDLLNLFKQMTGNITGLGLARPYWKNSRTKPKNIKDIDLDKDRSDFLALTPAALLQETMLYQLQPYLRRLF